MGWTRRVACLPGGRNHPLLLVEHPSELIVVVASLEEAAERQVATAQVAVSAAAVAAAVHPC